MLVIYLLGDFRVERDGISIPTAAWSRRKTKALLKLLAIHPNHQIHKEQAMDLLWPDLDPTSARDNLYRNLSFLRQTLEPDLQRPADSHFVTLNSEILKLADAWVDVDAFEKLLIQASGASDPAPSLEEALALYRADLLPEDAYEEWTIPRRNALRHAATGALYQLASVFTASSNYSGSISALQRLLVLDPTDEKAHRELMLAYTLAGRRADALHQYQQCARAVRTELGVDPEPETMALHSRILNGEITPASQTPILTKTATRRTNLPGSGSPIIGREQDVEAACALIIRPGVRLVTLTGSAGIGKTRLALEVASTLAQAHAPAGTPRFEDGTFFVSLAPIRDPDLVPLVIAQALDVKQAGDRSPLEALKAYLEDKHTLLVLDNFEQVVNSAPMLAQLLSGAPGLKILVTSRELLRLTAEHDFAVTPLTLPDRARRLEMEYLTLCSAIQLFIARARAVKPGFNLTPENADTISAICHRLDGIPLAIELAAARIRLLTPQAMLARLDNRLRLLVGGARDLPARQQTLYDAIGWSYDLLTTQERTLFARLSVFSEGWTEEAAAEVCDTPDTLDGLALLLDKSLIQQVAAARGEPRFTMLQTIREYAAERLTERDDLPDIRGRHARYFLSIAMAGEAEWFTEQQRYWLERFDEEQYNFRAVLEWALPNDPSLALQLCGTLWRYWLAHGFLTEGRRWLEEAIARVPSQKEAIPSAYRAVRARALFGAGVLSIHQADYTRAQELIAQSLGVARTLDDKMQIGNSLIGLSIGATYRGDYDRANTLLEEALLIFREQGQMRGMSLALNTLSIAALGKGDYVRAAALAEESLALSRRGGDDLAVGASLANLGLAILEQGDTERAAALLEESLALRRLLKDKGGIAHTQCILGRVVLLLGEVEQAADLYRESLAARYEMGDREGMAAPLEGLAAVAAAQGHARRTARLYGAANALREAIAAPMPPVDRPQYERALATAQALVDEAAWSAEGMAGRRMGLDQVVAYALSAQPPG